MHFCYIQTKEHGAYTADPMIRHQVVYATFPNLKLKLTLNLICCCAYLGESQNTAGNLS